MWYVYCEYNPNGTVVAVELAWWLLMDFVSQHLPPWTWERPVDVYQECTKVVGRNPGFHFDIRKATCHKVSWRYEKRFIFEARNRQITWTMTSWLPKAKFLCVNSSLTHAAYASVDWVSICSGTGFSSVQRHYRNQFCIIVNWTHGNTF